ncbi:MAG: hypothetical protein E6G39_14920, partial [Actinobacteria bacterium]
MTDARLVTLDEGSAQLAHEALIREWPQLQRWLDEDRSALRLHRHLTTAAEAWVSAGRDAGELYRGQRLAAATEWRASGPALSTTEEEFIDASVADQDRGLRNQMRTNRRLRVLLGAVAVVLVIALVAGAIAALRLHRHLTTAAEAWVSAGRDAGELYRGQRLAAATEWRASGPALSTTEEEFIDASVAEQDRVLRNQMRTNRRLRVLLGAVAVVLVIALVASAVAF